jgi:hypothetical protein
MEVDHGKEFTEGVAYLEAVRMQEGKCRVGTEDAVREFGRNLPGLDEHLGTVLSMLERAACCWWGCAEGDHAVENLVGRAYGLACGSYALMQAGRYDEALLLIRALGEITNLLTLFATESAELQKWRGASDEERRQEFSPVKIRLALERRKIPIPMDQARYKVLCGLTAHPAPATKPGMHNPAGRPVLGGHVQIAGVVVVLNELARVVGCAAISAASILQLPANAKIRMRNVGADLLRSSGPLTLQTIGEVLARYPRPAVN